MTLYFVGAFIIFTIAVAGAVYGLLQAKYLRSSFKWLAVFLLFSGVAQILAIFIGKWLGNNTFYNNLIIPLYYILVYLIFANFSKDRRTETINNYLFITGAVFLFIFLGIDINQGVISTKAISISNFVYSIAAFIFFFDLIKKPLRESPLKTAKFYLLFGFLFYHSSIIFFWAAEAIFSSYVNKYSITYVNLAMLFIYYCILTTSLVVEIKNNRANGY